jgi:hypothetical protein
MATIQQELDSFHRFASERVGNGGADLSVEELLDLWRASSPNPKILAEDARAVQAAIRDLEAGEKGRPFDQFAEDFRKRNRLAD